MDITRQPERSLLELTPYGLLQRYPHLPIWAVIAFQSLKQPQQLWTPEARALLNMAHVPPTGMPLEKLRLHVGTTSEELQASFANHEDWQHAQEHIDLWRLSQDLIEAKIAGWKQSEGKRTLGSHGV